MRLLAAVELPTTPRFPLDAIYTVFRSPVWQMSREGAGPALYRNRSQNQWARDGAHHGAHRRLGSLVASPR